jgi:hypothetical protein
MTVGPYNSLRIDNTHTAEIVVRIKEEVLALNSAVLRFKSSPLRSSVKSAAASVADTSSTAASHRHKMFDFQAAQTQVNCDRRYSCRLVGGGQMNVIFGKAAQSSDADLVTEQASGSHSHTIPVHTHALIYGIFEDTVFPENIRVAINGIDRTVELGGPWGDAGSEIEVEADIITYLVNASGGLQQNHEIKFSCDSSQGQLEAEAVMLLSIQAIAVGG